MKKIIITAAAAVAIIAPSASFASDNLNIPTFNFGNVEKAVQPVTKLNIQTASEAVRVPVEANEQK